jgi:transposase
VGEEGEHDVVTRHAVQVLRKAGHTVDETATLVGISPRSVDRIQLEALITSLDEAELKRGRKKIGRPSKVEAFREAIAELILEEDSEGHLLQSGEIFRRIKAKGYDGGKSAAFALIASMRPKNTRPIARFEGLPGEFCQHDFGQVDVLFVDGTKKRIHFFASRLKWSRWACVTIVDNERVETIVRTQLQHFAEIGGLPLLSVFDRPRTIAHKWAKNGVITGWNQTFVNAEFEIGVGVDVCWPYRPNQKGAVENLVGWVKGSFFKQRKFVDERDLHEQLAEWLVEVNTKTKSRATDEIPATRMKLERERLRPLKLQPHELAIRVPVLVGPTAHASFEGNEFMLPAAAMGISGTVFVHESTLRFVVGKHQVVYDRPAADVKDKKFAHPHLRADFVKAVTGDRAKLFTKREQLLDVGQPAFDFLTELVHRKPRTWRGDVEKLHDLLLRYDSAPMFEAFQRALAQGTIGAEYVAHYLRTPRLVPSPSPSSSSLVHDADARGDDDDKTASLEPESESLTPRGGR